MIRKLLFLAVMAFALVASADNYTFHEGENVIKPYAAAEATFTPDRDGRVLVECSDAFWVVEYSGVKYDHRYAPGAGGYAYVYEIPNVLANTTISMTNSFPMGDRVRISVYGDGAVPVKALAVTPRIGTAFNWTTMGQVSVNFNKDVTISGIKLIAGDYTADVDDIHLGSSLGFSLTKALNGALNGNYIKAGDKFQVKITGLRDANDKANLYNGNGELILEYIAPHPQHGFVSATVGENQLSYMQANTYKFLSYYSANAEDGLFTFEFNGEIGKVGAVILTMGNLDLDTQGKYHRSSVPYTISGNKLLVDARGVLRTIAVLFPTVLEEDVEEGEQGNDIFGSFDTEHITLTLQNVLDVNGNPFISDAPGSVGSYSFVMNYEEIIDEAYIDGDNKQDGDPVREGEEVSIWMSNANIGFDGLEVTYFVEIPSPDELEDVTYQPRRVVVTEYSVEPDGFGGVVITFKMPQMPQVAEGTKVRVALNNAASNDGMPHYLYIDFKASVSTEDAISQVEVEKNKASKTYRLDGAEAAEKLASGLYIMNGKKVAVK